MSTEILNKIAKLKDAHDNESDSDVKARYAKKIADLEKQLLESEAAVEQKQEKAEKEENQLGEEVQKKISKLKSAIDSESDPEVKARYQKKIDQLEGKFEEVKTEIKEEKKEVAEQKKELKEAAKEVKSAKKEVRKAAIKKVSEKTKERKKTEQKQTKRKSKLKEIMSDLDKLIEKNKKLKSLYEGKDVDLKRDSKRSAKPRGYRFVGKHDYRVPTAEQIKRGKNRGTIDYENRANRADVYPKGSKGEMRGVKLEKGGKVGHSHEDGMRTAKPSGLRYRDSALGKVWKNKKITQSDLLKHPTREFAEKYPNLVYTENRLTKSDDHPSIRNMSYADGGMMAHGGMADNVYGLVLYQGTPKDAKDFYDFVTDFMPDHEITMVNDDKVQAFISPYEYDLIKNEAKSLNMKDNGLEMKHGGMMAHGGKVDERQKLGLKLLKALSGFNDGQTLNGLLELLGYSQYRFGKYATESQVNDVKKELQSLIKMGYVEESGLGYKETKDGRVYLDSFDYGSYADGGVMDEVNTEVLSVKGNIMGTTSLLMKIKGMKKPQDFIVYPISADQAGKPITIQSDTRFGYLDLKSGRGLMSQSHSNGAYSYHFSADKKVPFKLSETDVQKIKEHLSSTAGSKVGNSVVFSDNSGASMMADGGMMAKGGKIKRSKEDIKKDEQRFAKPAGWRWKNSAVDAGIITKSQLGKTPSAKMRKEYPDYVQYEDRATKSDKRPSRKFKSL
jgi:hypothetical protein